ncbi:MAG: glycerol-3-phosphate 1-O-acyltransferase PlsY [Deltaproteobacteria bacterium]|nr:glycerol-3-phosphate 1-O-acyltransferase PlsY [Candidatus Anaeroferrophillacea bacterium]
MSLALFLIAAYLLGAIPCGLLIAHRFTVDDPRTHGSGNIGATNIARTAGKKAGLLTLFADALKGALPVLVAHAVFPGRPAVAAGAGLLAVTGHIFPLYLGFKGGKGVATALGVFLTLAPPAVAVEVLIFGLTLGVTRIVAAGSMVAALTLPVCTCLLGYPAAVTLAAAVTGGLVVYRHRENLKRLLDGTENRFF